MASQAKYWPIRENPRVGSYVTVQDISSHISKLYKKNKKLKKQIKKLKRKCLYSPVV